MLIRKVEERDIDDVVEIENDSFSSPYPREIFLDYLSSDYFLLSEDDDEITGYILAEKRYGHGVIVSLAVKSERRLEGIGTSLMESVMDKMEAKRYFLIVRKSNTEARLFYPTLGFSEVTSVDNYYSNGEDGILMQKKRAEENN